MRSEQEAKWRHEIKRIFRQAEYDMKNRYGKYKLLKVGVPKAIAVKAFNETIENLLAKVEDEVDKGITTYEDFTKIKRFVAMVRRWL